MHWSLVGSVLCISDSIDVWLDRTER
jgi:hypothetical protein